MEIIASEALAGEVSGKVIEVVKVDVLGTISFSWQDKKYCAYQGEYKQRCTSSNHGIN
ncbi:MAG: hypothetical protein WBA93_34695 [Microcoleaceae cyanobacterium]